MNSRRRITLPSFGCRQLSLPTQPHQNRNWRSAKCDEMVSLRCTIFELPMTARGLGCVKTRRCGEQIEWTFRQITIRVMRIFKRGQFRSIRERSFFSFSSFRGFHTAWVKSRALASRAISPSASCGHWSTRASVGQAVQICFRRQRLRSSHPLRPATHAGSSVSAKAISRNKGSSIFCSRKPMGSKSVKPTMQETAAWLSLWDENVAKQVARRQPFLLLTAGDPATLSRQAREELLVQVVERIASGERVPLLDFDTLKRFCRPDLAQAIRRLWVVHENHVEARPPTTHPHLKKIPASKPRPATGADHTPQNPRSARRARECTVQKMFISSTVAIGTR